MYKITDKGKERADRIDRAHNAREAILVLLGERSKETLEFAEIAAFTNVKESKTVITLRGLEKEGLVTNLNPTPPITVPTLTSYDEKQSTGAKVATGTVGGMKKLGNLAIAITKRIAKDPGVIGRAAIGNPETVLGPQRRKQQVMPREKYKFPPSSGRLEMIRRKREQVLRGRRY